MQLTPPKTSHLERTATEPRNADFHTVVIRDVQSVNDSVRLFRLGIPEGTSVKFLAGQWLDTYVPGDPKAGGFTVTSPPSKAQDDTLSAHGNNKHLYLELAIQQSPANPATVFLFRPIDEITGTSLRVRVGGSFVFPPQNVPASTIRRVIFIAGGVGINPLISMVGHIAELKARLPQNSFRTEVHFLYSSRLPLEVVPRETPSSMPDRLQSVLFLDRLAAIWAEGHVRGSLQFFFTGNIPFSEGTISIRGKDFETRHRRIQLDDLIAVVGSEDKKAGSLAYVCGVPEMTDHFVHLLTCRDGIHMDTQRVFFEKWW